VSKILSLRLKNVLHKVTDGRQSAFLEGRGLMDNILVANEVLEEVKRKKTRCVFFKVDYEKAYDSVIWDFIYYMLDRLDLCGKWIEWVRACLESSSVSMLINRSLTQEFKPKKGLRQGDPLTPFLFLIVAEELVKAIRKAVEKDMLESLEIGDKSTKVSMLQYVDDTLFFCKVKVQSVFVIKVILKCFELASGLKVNFEKSSIGGVGGDLQTVQRCASILNCALMETLFKYLGMLVGGCHKRSKFWEEVVERVRNRLGRWKGRYISMAERLCMIKSILSSLPMFYMSL